MRELSLDERSDIYLQLLSTVRRMFTRRWARRARTRDIARRRGILEVYLNL